MGILDDYSGISKEELDEILKPYESKDKISEYRDYLLFMSTGIKLKWYQKMHIKFIEMYINIDKKIRPWKYPSRYYINKYGLFIKK